MGDLEDKFGLKAIPLKSQGSDTDEYDFVPSSMFNDLVDEIERVLTTIDPRAIIVQGPQGSGKTATRRALVSRYQDKPDHIVISMHLASLHPRDLVWSFVNELMKRKFVTEDFLRKIDSNIQKEEITSKLEEILLKIIEQVVTNEKKCIWIIDEFDLIVPFEVQDSSNVTVFLHFISNILNGIADLVTKEKKNGFCTIIEQTKSSAVAFEKFLAERHTPLQSRVKGKNFDIMYDESETLEIVSTRLKSERESNLTGEIESKVTNNPFFPMKKETIQWLFGAINNQTQTSKLISFRDMEQILHDAFTQALNENLEDIPHSMVQEIFSKNKERLRISVTSDQGIKLNIQTENQLKQIITDEDHEIANNFYLDGIKKGMEKWENIYTSVYAADASSFLKPTDENGSEAVTSPIFMNKIRIDLKVTKTEQTETGGTKVNTSEHSIVWYCASKKHNNSFDDSDFEYINEIIKKDENYIMGTQKSLLTIFDDIPAKKEDELKEIISSVDEIFIHDQLTKEHLVGLAFVGEKDKDNFRDTYDTTISRISEEHLGVTLHNIGRKITPSHKILVQILYCKSLIDQDVKRIDLIKFAKDISNLSIRNTTFNEIILMDFSNENNVARVPSNLKSIKKMLDKQMDINKIKENFGGNDYTIQAAKELGLIDKNNNWIDQESRLTELEGIINQITEFVSTATTFETTNLKLLKLLNDAIAKINEGSGDEFQKGIILNFLKEKGSDLLQDVSLSEPTDESTGEDEGESTGEDEGESTGEGKEETKKPITAEILKEVCVNVEKKYGPLGLPDLIEKINVKSEFKGRKDEWTQILTGMIFSGVLFQTTKKKQS